MQKLCINCHYIGKSSKWESNNRFLIVLLIFLAMAFVFLGFWNPLFVIGTYLCLLLAIAGIDQVIKKSFHTCPLCGQISLIPANSYRAQNIIRERNLEVETTSDSFLDLIVTYDSIHGKTRKICKHCRKLSEPINTSSFSMTWAVCMLTAGIITIPLAVFHPLYTFPSAVFIFAGITTILFCLSEPDRCDKCQYRSLIPLNSSEGRKILHEENLPDVQIIDRTTESKLFFIHENISLILIIFSWALLGYMTFLLYRYFSTL